MSSFYGMGIGATPLHVGLASYAKTLRVHQWAAGAEVRDAVEFNGAIGLRMRAVTLQANNPATSRTHNGLPSITSGPQRSAPKLARVGNGQVSRGESDNRIADLFSEWEREEGARREQQERLKNLFADAKGFNTKALRAAFRECYAELHEDSDKRQKREANDADVQMYLNDLARVRMREPDVFGDQSPALNEPTGRPVDADLPATPSTLGEAGGTLERRS